jgi:hypothetical protein
MKKIFTIIAAAAIIAGCGGKEEEEEVSHSVEAVKSKLVGTWGNPAFSFPDGVPETFYSTACDTLKSPQFKPFEYDKDDTPRINEALFNHLLTSITFSDGNTASDEINVTFEFKKCDISFTKKLKMADPFAFKDNFEVAIMGSGIINFRGEMLLFSSSEVKVYLYRQN